MRPLALCLAVLSLVACGGGGGAGEPGGRVPADVGAAPEQVTVEGRTYTLVVDLGRDLMPRIPTAPPGGIQGTIFLRADAESNVPDGMRAERAWLIRGTEARELVPEPLQTLVADRRFHLSLGLRDGPVWDAGSRVDVVLRFSAGGRTYHIAARGIEVVGFA